MSRYRKIDPRIWNDKKFRTLGDDARLVFFLLLTHPDMTCIGAMRATSDGLAAECGWARKRMKKAIEEIVSLGIAELDSQASFIGIPNFLRYNSPEGPNSVKKAWLTALDLIPECRAREHLIARCETHLRSTSTSFRAILGEEVRHAFPEAFRDAIPDAKLVPSSIQEQEQEQNQEQEKAGARGKTPGTVVRMGPAELVEIWNSNCGGMAPAEGITPERRIRLLAFAERYPELDPQEFGRVVAALSKDAWACGEARRKSRYSIDEIVSRDAFERQREKVAGGTNGQARGPARIGDDFSRVQSRRLSNA